ncbi:MAG: HD domain-containing protein [Candidatus Aureabacteria bacterium]|nr:HD domain-containing protein [Candidatus Auribacterota bacterium]
MRTKNPHSAELLKPSSPVLKVMSEFLQLKNLYRQGWLKRKVPEDACESVADHTLGVTLLCLFLAENYFPDADRLKLLRMSLTHEAGEIYAGDITPVDGVAPEEKHAREKVSARRAFQGLPQADAYLALWEEFEESATLEARIVRQADRLEMLLQAVLYEKLGYYNFEEFFRNTESLMRDPEFKRLFEEVRSIR